MSSFVGHSLAAMSIFSLTKQPIQISIQKVFWLIWLIIIASTPDIDYLVPALNSSANHGLRITHSLTFSLLLPSLTTIIFVVCGIRGRWLNIYIWQIILAGLSHLTLDFLVGVTPLPFFWPFSPQLFKLPFGILPSAGRIDIFNYYFYRNLLIEIGVLLPLFLSLYLIRNRLIVTIKQKTTILILIFCSIWFIFWAYNLPR